MNGVKMSVRNTYSRAKVDRLVDAMIEKGMTDLGRDIKRRAIILEPVLTGRMRQNTESFPSATTVKVIVDTPYARIRHEINKLHPETRHYLTNALKSITDVGKYFKGYIK